MSATLDLATCPILTLEDIGELVRNQELAKRGAFHEWIIPFGRTAPSAPGRWLYSRQEADSFAARLMSGQLPPAIPRKKEEAQP